MKIVSTSCSSMSPSDSGFSDCLTELTADTPTGTGQDLAIQITSSRIYLQFSPEGIEKPEPTSLIILDTGNHCVRKLNLTEDEVTTIAGICGQSGFKDGPLGKALFNEPDRLGLSTSGEIFIFDKGNKYLRKLVKNGDNWLVKTMIGGACRNISDFKGVSGLEWIGLDESHASSKLLDILIILEQF